MTVDREQVERELRFHLWKFRLMCLAAPLSLGAVVVLDGFTWGVLIVLAWSLQASLDTGRTEVLSARAALASLDNPPQEGK